MINVQEIRERLASYVAHEIPYSEFEDWLLSASWNMHLDSSEQAQELVHEIKSPMYDYLDGLIDEDELRNQFRPQVQRYHLKLVMPEAYRPSSSSPPERRSMAFG